MSAEVLSLVKYVGGKGRLLAARPELFPLPQAGGAVALPFVGGGSVAAWYASRGHRVVASDINPRLVNAHREVQRAPLLVIGLLGEIVAAWRRALERAAPVERDGAGRIFFEGERSSLDIQSPPSMAARFLFVVRAGFNGLYRENAAGECTTAYGKPELTCDLVQADKLQAYSAAIQGVEFLCEDFAVTMARARPGWASYADPPYQGTFDGYAGGDWDARQAELPGMGVANDRVRLAEMLRYLSAIGVRAAVSDSLGSVTARLYGPARLEVVQRSGHVSCDGEGRQAVSEGFWRYP